MIRKWSEKKIIKALLIVMTLICALELSYGLISLLFRDVNEWRLASFNNISIPRINGKFQGPIDNTERADRGLLMITFVRFMEYCLLFKAIEAQMTINTEYNIFYETLFVTIVWFICSSITSYVWVIDKEDLNTGVKFMKLTLVDMR